MYVHDTKESIFLKIIFFKFQNGRQNPKWLPKCHKFALSGISLYEKLLNANKYEWIIATVEKVLILWRYCFKYLTKMAAKIQNGCQISIFWHIYYVFDNFQLLWWLPLGFELLNPNPFGARLQMLSIFFYSPFLKMCEKWLNLISYEWIDATFNEY